MAGKKAGKEATVDDDMATVVQLLEYFKMPRGGRLLLELAKLALQVSITTGHIEDCMPNVVDTVVEETRATKAGSGCAPARARIALDHAHAAGVACAAGQRKSNDGTTAVKTAAGTTNLITT